MTGLSKPRCSWSSSIFSWLAFNCEILFCTVEFTRKNQSWQPFLPCLSMALPRIVAVIFCLSPWCKLAIHTTYCHTELFHDTAKHFCNQMALFDSFRSFLLWRKHFPSFSIHLPCVYPLGFFPFSEKALRWAVSCPVRRSSFWSSAWTCAAVAFAFWKFCRHRAAWSWVGQLK